MSVYLPDAFALSVSAYQVLMWRSRTKVTSQLSSPRTDETAAAVAWDDSGLGIVDLNGGSSL